MSDYIVSNELKHHGILGMHWGVRRYQNPDGTLTAAGKQRYGNNANFEKEYRSGDTKTAGRLAAKYKQMAKTSGISDSKKAKYKSKAEKYKKMEKVYGELDRKTLDFLRTRSKAATVARTILAGPMSNQFYVKMRALGFSSAKSFVATSIIPAIGGIIVGNELTKNMKDR